MAEKVAPSRATLPHRVGPALRRQVGRWVLAGAVGAADLLTRAWACSRLGPLPSRDHRWLRVGLVTNSGAGFGLGAGHPGLVLVVSAVAIVGLAVWLARTGRRAQWIGLAMALGGGVGNLADRIAHGAVTDWIRLGFYPDTFNLADVAIRAGLVLVLLDLAWASYIGRRRRGPARAGNLHTE